MQLLETEQGVFIMVKVTPNASRNAIVLNEDIVTVKLTAPPVEGKANKELVKFLAKRLKIPPSAITIVKGRASRDKKLFVCGLDQATAKKRLTGAGL